jgi:UDP-N-acetylenolpyruvoylglucosamine reductase
MLPVWTPRADPTALAHVERACLAAGLAPERDRALGRQTTLGVGGPASLYVACPDLPALTALALALADTDPEQVPVFVLGKGSNTLIGDGGIDALVVRLGAGHKWLRRDGDTVSAGAGEAMPALAAWAAREGLAGLEFAAGIPATVGGSVRMNAGAHGGEVAAGLMSVDVLTPGAAQVATLRPDGIDFGYRRSLLPARSVVVAARWQLRPEDPAVIRARLDELRAWRRRTQPLRERNCGSVFTNPAGDSAGRLIEAAGLKGLRVGGAAVSDKHANFVVVADGATASDVRALVDAVRTRVRAATGVLLEPEVRLVGTFR